MVLMPAPIAMVWATEVLVSVMVATEDTTTVKHPEIVKLSETKTQQNLSVPVRVGYNYHVSKLNNKFQTSLCSLFKSLVLLSTLVPPISSHHRESISLAVGDWSSVSSRFQNQAENDL